VLDRQTGLLLPANFSRWTSHTRTVQSFSTDITHRLTLSLHINWLQIYPYQYVTYYPNWHVYSLLSKCHNGRPFHRSPSHTNTHLRTITYFCLNSPKPLLTYRTSVKLGPPFREEPRQFFFISSLKNVQTPVKLTPGGSDPGGKEIDLKLTVHLSLVTG